MRGRGLAWAGAAALVLLLVWQQIQSVRLSYEVEQTRRLVRLQGVRNAYLRLEFSTLASPKALAAEGGRLAMEPPRPQAVVTLAGSPGSPGTGPGPVVLSRLSTFGPSWRPSPRPAGGTVRE